MNSISINDKYAGIHTLDHALNIHDADVHIYPIAHYAFQSDGTYLLASNTSVGAISITLTGVVGLVIGDYLHITDTSNNNHDHVFVVITNIVGNVLTLSNPLDNAYLAASTTVVKSSISMNVNGSLGSPQIFTVIPDPGKIWHITSMTFTMLDQTAMDDSTFGGVAALTNGVIFRVKDANNGTYSSLFRWDTNNSMLNDGFTTVYSAKAPSGYYGYSGSILGRDVYGAIFRLANTTTENVYLEILIQDNLTGLNDFKIKVQGHLEQ